MIQDILNGTHDNDLDAIVDAVQMRRKRLAGQIGIGTKVRVKNIRPKYLVGATGTITGRNQKTFDFTFDEGIDTGRFGRSVRIPMTSVEPV